MKIGTTELIIGAAVLYLLSRSRSAGVSGYSWPGSNPGNFDNMLYHLPGTGQGMAGISGIGASYPSIPVGGPLTQYWNVPTGGPLTQGWTYPSVAGYLPSVGPYVNTETGMSLQAAFQGNQDVLSWIWGEKPFNGIDRTFQPGIYRGYSSMYV